MLAVSVEGDYVEQEQECHGELICYPEIKELSRPHWEFLKNFLSHIEKGGELEEVKRKIQRKFEKILKILGYVGKYFEKFQKMSIIGIN